MAWSKKFVWDDENPMMPVAPCIMCRHLRTPDQSGERPIPVCAAFPKGIPDAILSGADYHHNPLPMQGNDIVFEAGAGVEAPEKFLK